MPTAVRRRSFFSLRPACGLAAALLFFGCADSDSQPNGKVHLRMSIFSGQSEQELAQRFVRGFERSHPNISVTLEPIPGSSYGSKLGMQSAANTLPDVVFLVDNLLPTLVRYRVLRDLWPFARGDKAFAVNDIYPAMLENGLDGQNRLFMLPRELGVVVLFYNRTLLRKAGLPDPPPTWTRVSRR